MEADQEENEEAGDMDDEEINEIIARSDEEAVLFREFCLKCEREMSRRGRLLGTGPSRRLL